jgi:hypothetical protein
MPAILSQIASVICSQVNKAGSRCSMPVILFSKEKNNSVAAFQTKKECSAHPMKITHGVLDLSTDDRSFSIHLYYSTTRYSRKHQHVKLFVNINLQVYETIESRNCWFTHTCSDLSDHGCSVDMTRKWTLPCSMEYHGLSLPAAGMGK